MVLGLMQKNWRLLPGLLVLSLVLLVVGGQTVFAHALLADYDCEGQTSVSVEECQSLVALYNSTGGESWSNSDGWLTSSDLCTWYGVSCNQGHIVALDMFNNNLSGSLSIDIGGFPYLKTLTLNDNRLTGPIPITITFLDLDLFHFHGTSLCEPVDPAFQDWYSQIVYRLSSGLYCSTLNPSGTPNAQTETAAADPDNLTWPQQTLTALAVAETGVPGLSTATPEATPTRYYSLETPTRVVVDNSDEASGSFGSVEEEQTKSGQPQGSGRSGFLSNIPPSWLLLLLVPIVLIVVGIVLELRDRKQEGEKPAFSSWLEFGGTKEEKKKDKKKDKKEEKAEEPEEDDLDDFDMYDFGQN